MIKVKVKLFGVFRKYADEPEVELELEDEARASAVLKVLNIPDRPDTWLLINGAPKDQDWVLGQGDEISIFQPVGGG